MDRFGIPQLDRLLPSIPQHSSIVLVNDPGIEAEAFLYQSTQSHLKAGRRVVYAVFNRAPSSVLRSMAEFGFETDAGDVLFVDGFSALMGASEDAAYVVRDPKDLDAVAAVLAQAAKDHPDAVLVIDPLSSLLDHTTFEAFTEAFAGIHTAMKAYRLSVALFTKWPYKDDPSKFLADFDGVVRLRGVQERVLVSQYFIIERASWLESVTEKPILYKTIRPGGVFAYIPKIVVTGPYHAGKSTFVQTLSDTAVSVNRLGTTIVMDHGHVTLDGLTADIFGTPGQERFDPILRTIAGQALGVIVVVDSTKPETFPRATEMMQQTWRQGLPIIIAANKQDEPHAIPADEVQARLGTPRHVRVLGCTATSRESTLHVLRELIDQIMGVRA